MTVRSTKGDLVKTFEGSTQAEASARVTEWTRDFSTHGVLLVTSIFTAQQGAKWVATITYREKK